MSVIEPALLYPLVNTLFKAKDLCPITSIISQLQCSSLGLKCNFPWALLHGSMALEGMGNPSADQKITRDRVHCYFFNARRSSTIADKFEISVIYTQLKVGLFEKVFVSPCCRYGHLDTPSQGVQIWSFGIHLCAAENYIWLPLDLVTHP